MITIRQEITTDPTTDEPVQLRPYLFEMEVSGERWDLCKSFETIVITTKDSSSNGLGICAPKLRYVFFFKGKFN